MSYRLTLAVTSASGAGSARNLRVASDHAFQPNIFDPNRCVVCYRLKENHGPSGKVRPPPPRVLSAESKSDPAGPARDTTAAATSARKHYTDPKTGRPYLFNQVTKSSRWVEQDLDETDEEEEEEEEEEGKGPTGEAKGPSGNTKGEQDGEEKEHPPASSFTPLEVEGGASHTEKVKPKASRGLVGWGFRIIRGLFAAALYLLCGATTIALFHGSDFLVHSVLKERREEEVASPLIVQQPSVWELIFADPIEDRPLPVSLAAWMTLAATMAWFFCEASTRSTRYRFSAILLGTLFVAVCLVLTRGACEKFDNSEPLPQPPPPIHGKCLRRSAIAEQYNLDEICPQYLLGNKSESFVSVDLTVAANCTFQSLAHLFWGLGPAISMLDRYLKNQLDSCRQNLPAVTVFLPAAGLKAMLANFSEAVCATILPPCRETDCAVFGGGGCSRSHWIDMESAALGGSGAEFDGFIESMLKFMQLLSAYCQLDAVQREALGLDVPRELCDILPPSIPSGRMPKRRSLDVLSFLLGELLTIEDIIGLGERKNDILGPELTCLANSIQSFVAVARDENASSCRVTSEAAQAAESAMFARVNTSCYPNDPIVPESFERIQKANCGIPGTMLLAVCFIVVVAAAATNDASPHVLSKSSFRSQGGVRVTGWRVAAFGIILLSSSMSYAVGSDVLRRSETGGWASWYFAVSCLCFALALFQLLPRRREPAAAEDGTLPNVSDGEGTRGQRPCPDLGCSAISRQIQTSVPFRILFDPAYKNGIFLMLQVIIIEVVELIVQLVALEEDSREQDGGVVVVTMTIIAINSIIWPAAATVMAVKGVNRFHAMQTLVFLELVFDEMLAGALIFYRTGARDAEADSFMFHAAKLVPLLTTALLADSLRLIRGARRTQLLDSLSKRLTSLEEWDMLTDPATGYSYLVHKTTYESVWESDFHQLFSVHGGSKSRQNRLTRRPTSRDDWSAFDDPATGRRYLAHKKTAETLWEEDFQRQFIEDNEPDGRQAASNVRGNSRPASTTGTLLVPEQQEEGTGLRVVSTPQWVENPATRQAASPQASLPLIHEDDLQCAMRAVKRAGWIVAAAIVVTVLVVEGFVASTFVSQRARCAEILGDAAHCTWPQWYFVNGLVGSADFCNLSSIKAIDCASSGVSNIHAESPHWKNLTGLETIDFRDNPRLRVVPGDGWASLGKKLLLIDLRDSGLQVLPPQLCDTFRMEEIERRAIIDRGDPTFHLSRLRINGTRAAEALDWSQERPPLAVWPTISETCLEQFKGLKSVNLSHTRLGTESSRQDFFRKFNLAFTPESFPDLHLVDLRNISLAGWTLNGGWSHSVLAPAMQRGGLLMGYNDITQLAVTPMQNESAIIEWLEWFVRTRSSRELSLVANASLATTTLKRVPQALKNFTYLKHLVMVCNQIDHIGPDTFRGLRNLSLLSMGTNALHKIPKDAFLDQKNMLALYLETNTITQVEAGAFKGCDNLRLLTLNNNKICTSNKIEVRDFFMKKKWKVVSNWTAMIDYYQTFTSDTVQMESRGGSNGILNADMDMWRNIDDVAGEHQITIQWPCPRKQCEP